MGQTFRVTSALLFVAILVVVELSYRRWVRGSLARRRRPSVDVRSIDLTEAAEELAKKSAAVIPMPPRSTTDRDARRSG